ncbi:hypothetical protein BJ742DRAFT_385962 [Cladochytrium replicatum]|nr:hypothetical protein BJ742DRAFT_385962 [Cladochytrium replicatum]
MIHSAVTVVPLIASILLGGILVDANQNTGGQQQQAGDSPFLDRASFVPKRLSVDGIDKYFGKQSAFCDDMEQFGLVAANGSQIRTGVCVSTVMGALPTVDNMPSQLIVEPENAAVVDRTRNITVKIKFRNFAPGFFDNPNAGYYIVPQTLNENGFVEGHTHITVQDLGDSGSAPDAKAFSFFVGVNAPANSEGLLTGVIPANKIGKDGLFRICCVSGKFSGCLTFFILFLIQSFCLGTFSHQPMIMPVAQRGAQDDCIRVKMVAGGGMKSEDDKNNDGNPATPTPEIASSEAPGATSTPAESPSTTFVESTPTQTHDVVITTPAVTEAASSALKRHRVRRVIVTRAAARGRRYI